MHAPPALPAAIARACGPRRRPRGRARGRGALLGALLLALLPAAPASSDLLPDALRIQIERALAEKAARTPVERKLDSGLLHAIRVRRGRVPVPGLPDLRSGAPPTGDGLHPVRIRGAWTTRLRERLARMGRPAERRGLRRRYTATRLGLEEIAALAALDEVTGIVPASRPFHRKLDTSEGDVAHRVAALRSQLGVDGTGLRAAVLSDGVDSLAARQASGDLPAGVQVLPGQAGSGDEGTAMLEIVHDLAPGAELFFATGFAGQSLFAQNILALRAAGADVLVDDVGYFAEGVFQDDDVAAAVDTVTADGALYFSSAGNAGNLDAGTAGVWEGDFADSGLVLAAGLPQDGAPLHDFGGGEIGDEVTEDTPFVFTLQWSDPLEGAANDYDLLLVDATLSTLIAVSTTIQDGDDDPFEIIDSTDFDDTGTRLLVVRTSGAARMLHLNTNRGELALATRGQIYGHPAARGALAVAAVVARDAAGPDGGFDGSEALQPFSSDGPRRVFFEADGSPIAPGSLLSDGGEVRAVPDLSGGDCVSTSTPGFFTFCGTSAAAPHLAAIAAVLAELAGGPAALPHLPPVLAATALDAGSPGPDPVAGAGIVDALAAGEALEAPVCANGLDDDGDGLVDFPTDPGCADASLGIEDPPCQDGLDNDGDGTTDFDGGVSILGEGNGDPGGPDPECAGDPAGTREGTMCGLGAGGVPLLLLLLRRRGRARGPRSG